MEETKGTSMLPLRTVLRANAAFSLLSGTILAAGSTALDDVLGIPTLWLATLGVGVVAFGLIVRRISEPDQVRRGSALLVVGADIAWVIGTAAVLLGFPELLSIAGRWTFGIIGLFVLDFALLQVLGLKDAA